MSEMLYDCSSLPYSNDLRSVFAFTSADVVIVYVVAPISILLALTNIFLLSKTRSLKEPPADILFFVSIFCILKDMVFLSTAAYDSVAPPKDPLPDSYDAFCQSTGVLGVIADIAKFTYNFVFCFYYVGKIRNPLKVWVSESKEIHVLCLLIISVSTAVVYFTDAVGVSLLGYCSFKLQLNSLFIDVGLSFGYTAVLLVSSSVFLKYLRHVSQTDSKTRLFFSYYFKYLILISLNNLLQGACFLSLAILCGNITSKQVNTITLIANITELITPCLITIILFNHPEIKRAIYHRIAAFLKPPPQQRSTFYDDLLTTNRNSVLIELNDLSRIQPEGYLNKLKQKNKASLLGSILGCISIDYLESEAVSHNQRTHLMRSSIVQDDSSELFGWNYEDRFELCLNDSMAAHYSGIFCKLLPAVSIKFTSLAPLMFRRLLDMSEKCNIAEAMNPQRNYERIVQNVESSGGRSGQFFYFNLDETLIIKTLPKKEMTVLIQRLPSYYSHFERAPNSFLVRIYGLYSIANIQTEEEIHFMMMSNLFKSINKAYLLRVYDLKGSSHQRQVAKPDHLEDEPAHYTLKDLDFQHYEGKVWIDPGQSTAVKEALKRDSQFLCENGLIDYSLIVIKINKDKLLEDRPDALNRVRHFASMKERHVVYIFGIIDYLETWNFKKKSEKWYKSLWAKSQGISAQDPFFYSRRFIDNLVCGIFP